MNSRAPRSECDALLDDPLISPLAKSIRCGVRVLAMLIAIETFIKIASYPREKFLRIKIALDYNEVSAHHAFATAAFLLALSLAFGPAVVRNTSINSHREL